MVKLKTREAIIGILVYRAVKLMGRRMLKKKGGIMASRKTAIFAALGALAGALFFWRKRKGGQQTGV
jgi:hypothetical protein